MMNRTALVLTASLLATGAAFAWDVEHDEVARLVGWALPQEIKSFFAFEDFDILLQYCHFPDMTDTEPRRFHTLDDIEAVVGRRDRDVIDSRGFFPIWMHTEDGKATFMTLLARAFARGERHNAAFYLSVLTHPVSDESALNHPPLLGFFRYSKLPGIDFTMRKVEEGAKNVFGFRSDGHVVHLVRERMKGYVPQVPAGSLEDALLSFGVEVAVIHGAKTGEIEGAIAFASQHEAERALVDLVYRQVCALEDIVWTLRARRPRRSIAAGEES